MKKDTYLLRSRISCICFSAFLGLWRGTSLRCRACLSFSSIASAGTGGRCCICIVLGSLITCSWVSQLTLTSLISIPSRTCGKRSFLRTLSEASAQLDPKVMSQ